jgi:nitrogen fixation/metabolism regulation signal transduction histidine kinase
MSERRRLPLETRLLWLGLLAGGPAVVVALGLLLTGGYSAKVQWTLGPLCVVAWLSCSFLIRERLVRQLQTLTNLIAALRQGDYSVRGHGGSRQDAFGEVMEELNLLREGLRTQRLGELEASALLAKVMEEIDVAVLAFDASGALRWVNLAGEKLLAQPGPRLVGQTAQALGLGELLHGDAPRRLDQTFPGGAGPWELRRSSFRQEGLPHELVVLADLRRVLHEEELRAWQRLVRVLSHEINNSLAPIQSIAASLRGLVGMSPRPSDWEEDVDRGLAVVGRRAEGLSRFMQAYARLAKLPPPTYGAVEVGPLVRRVAQLDKRLSVRVREGPEVTIQADGDQLEQLLINVVRNAVDASLETHGSVSVGWSETPGSVEIVVEDEGPGLPESTNLFVPFFTTKPEGSGIGLVLSRQIAEAHQGTLTLRNAPEHRGCEARLRVPRARRVASERSL